MTHEDLKESLAAFALDALGPLDRAEVKAHLETCPECDHHLNELMRVSSNLALTSDPVPVPRSLAESLLAEAREAGQLRPLGVKSRLDLPRASVALVAVLALVAALTFVFTQDRFVDDRSVPEVVAILASSQAITVPMEGTRSAPGASGQIFIPQNESSAAVVMTGLNDPGTSTYFLWMAVDGEPIGIKPFGPDPSGKAVVYVSRNVGSMEEMMVSLEVSRDVKSPKGRWILRSL